jgi:hypothetical protein
MSRVVRFRATMCVLYPLSMLLGFCVYSRPASTMIAVASLPHVLCWVFGRIVVHCIIGIHHFAVDSGPAPSVFIVNEKLTNWVPGALDDLDNSFFPFLPVPIGSLSSC